MFAIVDENGKIWVTRSEGPMLLRVAAEEPPATGLSHPRRSTASLFAYRLHRLRIQALATDFTRINADPARISFIVKICG